MDDLPLAELGETERRLLVRRDGGRRQLRLVQSSSHHARDVRGMASYSGAG
jgi:hypothetical protein